MLSTRSEPGCPQPGKPRDGIWRLSCYRLRRAKPALPVLRRAVGCLAVGLAATAGPSLGQEVMQGATTPLWPEKIAAVHADGRVGPWIDYRPPETRPTRGSDATGARFAPIWDSYELDPRRWNEKDNVPREFYDVPPGSGKFCIGKGNPNRLFWCDPQRESCETLPSCISANGGNLAQDAPHEADVISFLWGVLGTGKKLRVEIQLFDTYDATQCSDPGSNLVSGLLVRFVPPPKGFYRTTIDLARYGLQMKIPDSGRVGIKMIMWEDQPKGIPSDQAFPLLWPTKTDWQAVMGLDDVRGFSDAHGDNDCELDIKGDECVEGKPVCPNGDGPVGPAVLLLGQGKPGACIYKLKRDSKPRRGCQTCPRKGDLFATEIACDTKFDCPVKETIKKIDCPQGERGFCKKLKGKRDGCGRLP